MDRAEVLLIVAEVLAQHGLVSAGPSPTGTIPPFEALEAPAGGGKRVRVRCPSHPRDVGRCVRDEDHMGGHVDADGNEWLVALRCRIGAGDVAGRPLSGPPVCSRIEGHEPPCVPFPRPQGALGGRLDEAPPSAPPPPKRKRGFCQCGKGRQEHGGTAHMGPCAASNCEKYRP